MTAPSIAFDDPATDDDAHINLQLTNNDVTSTTVIVELKLPGSSTWIRDGDQIIAGDTTAAYTTDQYLITETETLDLRATNPLGQDSSTITLTGGTIEPPDGRSILLSRSDDTLRYLPVDRAPQTLSLDREHTAMSRWEGTVALRDYDRVEYDYLSPTTEAHIWFRQPRTGDLTYLFRGYFEQIDATFRQSGTRVAGRDVLKKLTEGRTSVTYTGTPTHDALEDYIDTYTDFSANLTQPSPVTLADDQQEQDADTTAEWDAITSLADTDPFDTSGDQLQLAQTNFFLDTTQDMSRSGTTVVTDSSYNEGDAEEFTGSGDSVSGSFTLDYDIPNGNVGFAIRAEATDAPEITFRLDGNDITTFNTGLTSSLVWHFDGTDFSDFAPGGITSGSHTVELAQTGIGGTSIQIDAISIYDTRYSYTFDNTVDGNQLLSGPAVGPTSGTAVELDSIDVGYNITAARIASTWDDTTGNQQLEASNDDGGSYPLSAANSSTLDQSFASSQVGTLGRVRLAFDCYGTRTTQSPTDNYQRQAVSDIQIFLDGNDLSVIDDQTFSRNHFRNILDMAEFANYRVVPVYDPNTLELDVFPKGTEASAEWTTLDSRRRVDTEGYFNEVYVEGRTPDSGSAPTATVSDADEIAAVGETLTLDIKDPELTTEADVKSKARSVLAQVTQAGGVVGEVDIMPTIVRPGYSYPVGEWTVPYGYGTDYGGSYGGGGDDAPVRPLERVNWSVRGGQDAQLDGRLTFQFSREDPLVALRRDTDTTRDVL